MSYRMTTSCNTKLDILQEEAPLAFPIELLRDVAEALELAVAHPDDYLCIIRSTHSPIRDKLRKLELCQGGMENMSNSY